MRGHHPHHHHHHHRHPGHRGGRRLWRARWGLRWRIFFWFGAAILVSGLVAGGILDASDGRGRPVALLVAGAILWIAAGAIAWSLTAPLLAIVRVTRDIGAGKLDSRLELGPHRHRGELRLLAEAVNDMADRIARQLADQRELLAGVSHELRTPLGHMRILVDTARERGTAPGLVDELDREILEVDALVGQLLASSRLDFEAVERRPIDAAELATLAVERAGLAATVVDADRDLPRVDADPTLLARALANLLANAASHGRGVTALRVTADATSISFVVEDAGPGFASGDLERVFERFYRGERRAGGSLGLGLSLVARIAGAHGGRAFAENRPDGGARVGFSLALAQP